MELKEFIQQMKADIERLENMVVEPFRYVVIFKNDRHDTIYALMDGAYNKISEDAQNIMPMPWIDQVLRLRREDADRYAATHSCIENRKGERFFAEVVKLIAYRDMLLADHKRVLATVEKYNQGTQH